MQFWLKKALPLTIFLFSQILKILVSKISSEYWFYFDSIGFKTLFGILVFQGISLKIKL